MDLKILKIFFTTFRPVIKMHNSVTCGFIKKKKKKKKEKKNSCFDLKILLIYKKKKKNYSKETIFAQCVIHCANIVSLL